MQHRIIYVTSSNFAILHLKEESRPPTNLVCSHRPRKILICPVWNCISQNLTFPTLASTSSIVRRRVHLRTPGVTGRTIFCCILRTARRYRSNRGLFHHRRLRITWCFKGRRYFIQSQQSDLHSSPNRSTAIIHYIASTNNRV